MTYVANRITIDPALCNGRPTIRGMGITVATVVEHLLAGDTKEDVLANYSLLEPEDIDACKAYALNVMNHRLTVRPLAA